MRIRSFVAAVTILSALSLTWAILPDWSPWTWPAMQAAPAFNLAAAAAAFVFARRASSRQQRLAGRVVAVLSIGATLFHALLALAIYGLKSALN